MEHTLWHCISLPSLFLSSLLSFLFMDFSIHSFFPNKGKSKQGHSLIKLTAIGKHQAEVPCLIFHLLLWQIGTTHRGRGYGLWSAWLAKSNQSWWEERLRKKVRAGTVIGHVATHGASSLGWTQYESQWTLQHDSQTSEKGHRSGLSTAGNILTQSGLHSAEDSQPSSLPEDMVRLASMATLRTPPPPHTDTHTLIQTQNPTRCRARLHLWQSLIKPCHHSNYYLI